MMKSFKDTCNRLDRIPACDRRTDGQTDILPRHSPRYAYASRGISRVHIDQCVISLEKPTEIITVQTKSVFLKITFEIVIFSTKNSTVNESANFQSILTKFCAVVHPSMFICTK